MDLENIIVLSYHDSLLYKSDVILLDGASWLNDKIIGFAFEYFENDLFKRSSDALKFVNPCIVQLAKLVDNSEVTSILEPLNLQSSQLIFVPINDNCSRYPGGSHWSLLVCDVKRKSYFHFDSSGSWHWNNSSAELLCAKLTYFFGTNFDKFEPKCPVQTNGHDCGVFVIAIAEKLAELYLKNSQLEIEKTDEILTHINPKSVKEKRKQLKTLIYSLKET